MKGIGMSLIKMPVEHHMVVDSNDIHSIEIVPGHRAFTDNYGRATKKCGKPYRKKYLKQKKFHESIKNKFLRALHFYAQDESIWVPASVIVSFKNAEQRDMKIVCKSNECAKKCYDEILNQRGEYNES